MKKKQIFALIISLIGLVITSVFLYRKKANKVAYGAVLTAAIVLYFVSSYVFGMMMPEDEKANKKADADLLKGKEITQTPEVISIPEVPFAQKTVPLDAKDTVQGIVHPSLNKEGYALGQNENNLVGPVMKIVG